MHTVHTLPPLLCTGGRKCHRPPVRLAAPACVVVVVVVVARQRGPAGEGVAAQGAVGPGGAGPSDGPSPQGSAPPSTHCPGTGHERTAPSACIITYMHVLRRELLGINHRDRTKGNCAHAPFLSLAPPPPPPPPRVNQRPSLHSL